VTPDQTHNLPTPAGINIFLYQVTPNSALRNADLPTRAGDGSILQKPQVALDLHYLLTFYGDDTLLEPQRLLGAATLALHANPTLPRSLIQPVPISLGITADSNLESQSQLVRLTPIAFSLEELSKLWSFLLKVDYVLSAAYVASVVLIETDDAVPPPALPVTGFTLNVLPMRQPVITQVVASPNAALPIVAGSDIALVGRNLTAPSGGATQVLIDGATQPPASIAPTRITLTLPAGLAAGPQTAQVMQPLSLGVPPVPHAGTGAASGLAAFVLNPSIAPGGAPGTYAITVLPPSGTPPAQSIRLTVLPTVRKGQRAVLQMLPATSPAAGFLFDGGTLTADADVLTIPIPGLAAGAYIVRILVDGAESPVVLGPGDVPTAPSVTV
jgi:hypothetical protein